MELTAAEKQTLEYAYKKERNAKVKIRILAIIYFYIEGFTLDQTANLLRISIGSVQEYKKKYDQGKLPGLRSMMCSSGRPPYLNNIQQEELKKVVSAGNFLTSNAVCKFVEQQFNVTYSAKAMSKLLKRLGFVHKKPKTVPGKADAEKQVAFLNDVLNPILNKADENNPVYFEDAVHMQHNTQAAYGWILKGKTKEIKQNSGRQRININGAICFHNQQFIYRNEGTINADAEVELLKKIRSHHLPDIRIKIVLDNARYNYASKVREYAEKHNIELLFLPPYSPNLNLIERLWGRLKKLVTHNQYYEKFSDFYQAVIEFFENIPNIRAELKKLLTPNFHIIGSAC